MFGEWDAARPGGRIRTYINTLAAYVTSDSTDQARSKPTCRCIPEPSVSSAVFLGGTSSLALTYHAKAYQCPKAECGRRFSVSSNLRRHMRVSSRATLVVKVVSDCTFTLRPMKPRPGRSPRTASNDANTRQTRTTNCKMKTAERAFSWEAVTSVTDATPSQRTLSTSHLSSRGPTATTSHSSSNRNQKTSCPPSRTLVAMRTTNPVCKLLTELSSSTAPASTQTARTERHLSAQTAVTGPLRPQTGLSILSCLDPASLKDPAATQLSPLHFQTSNMAYAKGHPFLATTAVVLHRSIRVDLDRMHSRGRSYSLFV